MGDAAPAFIDKLSENWTLNLVLTAPHVSGTVKKKRLKSHQRLKAQAWDDWKKAGVGGSAL